jgi:hypothetical protein
LRQIRILLGQTGGGKSWRLRSYIDESPRVVIYDTLGDPEFDKYRRIERFPDLCRFLAGNPAIFRVVYQWQTDVTQEEDFDRVCEAVYACRNVVFVVEEVAVFCNPNLIPIPLRKIVALGRHRSLSLYCTSQTPPQIHNLIRSQAHQIVSFNQTEPGHVSWCRAVMGEAADYLPGLRPHHSVSWDRGAGWTLRGPDWEVLESPKIVDTGT